MARSSDSSTSQGGARKVSAKKRTVKKAVKKKVNLAEESAAEVTLQEEQAVPQAVIPEPAAKEGKYFWNRMLAYNVRNRDIIVLLRQMIMLLEAGTPLLKTLHSLAERSQRGGVRAMVSDMAQFVEMGNPLWQAFARHRRFFDPVFVSLIQASEASGTLVKVLRRLAAYREARLRFARRIQAALIYPIMVVIFCIIVVFILGKFILPQFKEVFGKLDQKLPAHTKFVMDTFDLLTSTGFVVWTSVIVISLFVAYFLWTRTPFGRLKADRMKLWIPYVGPKIVRNRAIVEMTRSLSLLLGSGLSMLNTLDLTRRSITNKAVARILQEMAESVERGEGIEQPLRRAHRMVPPVVTDMLVTGEESGKLDEIAEQIADAYEEEVTIHISTLAELLPPLVAMLLGGVVLLVAISVFLPLIEMMSTLGAGS